MSESGKVVEHPVVRGMSQVERSEAQMRVALQTPGKLKEWLAQSGRTWLVFNGALLVDSCVWPEGAEAVQLICANYRDHRAGLKEPMPETLTIEELDRAIRYLVSQASALDPSWKLESDPL
jgi:hypothetical protein